MQYFFTENRAKNIYFSSFLCYNTMTAVCITDILHDRYCLTLFSGYEDYTNTHKSHSKGVF